MNAAGRSSESGDLLSCPEIGDREERRQAQLVNVTMPAAIGMSRTSSGMPSRVAREGFQVADEQPRDPFCQPSRQQRLGGTELRPLVAAF